MEIDTAPARLRALPSWLMNQACLPAQRLVAEGLAALGAHRSHFALLAALDEFGPASQAALGRRCGIDRSDMVALVNDLTDRQLVQRAQDTVDRRRNVITITPQGRRHLRDLDERVTEVQAELLSPLSSREREQLVQMLTRVLQHHTG